MAYKHRLADARHWIGWTLSSLFLTGAVILFYHLLENHVVHTPIWKVFALFGIIFVVEVVFDVIKHFLKLQ